jgi:hypothetical protein
MLAVEDKPWYHEGLQFECTRCGKCCSGEPGFVWVTDQEIAEIAQAVGETPERFEALYVRNFAFRKSLREYANGDCALLETETRLCKVHAVRPRQCRTWPFWDSNLLTPAAWQRTCDRCPGAGHGRLWELSEIEYQRSLMKI